MYDYILGGKTNYAVDREAAEKIAEVWPGVRATAAESRRFMERAIRYLAGELGMRQFLDIGTGIPTEPNLHQVAQGEAPDARVVYADKDPLVLAHANALMRSTPEGRTHYIHADMVTDIDRIMDEAFETLDADKPVVLSLFLLLHFVPDELDAHGLVRRVLDQLAPGSVLAISHLTADFDSEGGLGKATDFLSRSGTPVQARTREEVARFFEGLDVMEPGILPPHRWRTPQVVDSDRVTAKDREVSIWAGVAVKP